MRALARDGTAERVSREQILRHERGQGKKRFSCSADHEQNWQPHLVDPYSDMCDDHTCSSGNIRVWTVIARVALLSSPVNSTNEGPRIQINCPGKTLKM